jgi:RNA polymerase sigma factor (sigma-70 family)
MAHALALAENRLLDAVRRPLVPFIRPHRAGIAAVTQDGQVSIDSRELDELLLAVARTRDRNAFRKLFTYFAPRLKGYLIRLGSNPGTAEELAQEAMLTLWRKAGLFDPSRAAATTWVFTIARNLRIDAMRRERRPEFDPNDPAFIPQAEDEPDHELDRARLDAHLREAMSRLPREQVEVVELSFFSDKPHSVIAKELGLPLGTVKSRLRLAMGRLRLALERVL